MKERTFTGEDLEKALVNDELPQPGMELVGMVKRSEHEEHVSFTISGCDNWVDLPTSMIEQAENVGQSRCKDHAHPLFKIILKESKTPEAQILSALLEQSRPVRQAGPILTEQGPLPQAYSQSRRRGRFGEHFGVGVHPTNVAYWPTPTGYQCVGWSDCINMINSENCRTVECGTGWVTGDVFCICTT